MKKTTTFEWIMVAVSIIILICTIAFVVDYNMDMKEAKSESMDTVSIVDAKVEYANDCADEYMAQMIAFLLSDEYQEWVDAVESY